MNENTAVISFRMPYGEKAELIKRSASLGISVADYVFMCYNESKKINIATVADEFKEAKDTCESQNKAIEELKSEIATLKAKLEDNAENEALIEQLNSFKDAYNTATKDKGKLEGNINTLKGKIANLKKEQQAKLKLVKEALKDLPAMNWDPNFLKIQKDVRDNVLDSI